LIYCVDNSFFIFFFIANSKKKMSSGAQNNTAAQQLKNNIRVNLDRCSNFMRQFRDPESRELTKLSANQFMDVWSHYDKDGNNQE
jgi:plasmid stabilization system protein ParE